MNETTTRSRQARNGAAQRGAVSQKPMANPEAERAVLGAFMLDQRAVEAVRDLPSECVADAVRTIQNPTDPPAGEPLFADQRHQIIFGAACELFQVGETVGRETIATLLHDSGLLEQAGGAAFLAMMEDDVFAISQTPDLFKTIVKHWRRRIAHKTLAALYEAIATGEGVAQAWANAQRAVEAIEDGGRAAIRTLNADELFSEAIDTQLSLLGDNVLQPGGLTLVVGPQGIGKSRAVMQMIVEALIGCERWLGEIPIHRHDINVLLFQTENSPARMNRELRLQLKGTNAEQRERVVNGFRFIVPDRPADLFLPLDDPHTVERLTGAVKNFNPDIVIYDPYAAFFAGENENDAVQTRETVAAMMRIAQAGKSDAAVVIVHHARSGRAAAAGAIGWDKSSYARGSKALSAIARAQINIAPGDPDDPSVLVIGAGKVSDGRPFEPFAARLDPGSMLYRADHDFDLDAWREELEGGGSKAKNRQKVSDDLVLLVVRDMGGSGRRSAIVAGLRDATGCGSSVAYEAVKRAIEGGKLFAAGDLISLPCGPIR